MIHIVKQERQVDNIEILAARRDRRRVTALRKQVERTGIHLSPVLSVAAKLAAKRDLDAHRTAGQFTQSCIDTVKITDPVRGSLGLRAQFQNDLLAHASRGDQEGKNHHTYDQLDQILIHVVPLSEITSSVVSNHFLFL